MRDQETENGSEFLGLSRLRIPSAERGRVWEGQIRSSDLDQYEISQGR